MGKVVNIDLPLCEYVNTVFFHANDVTMTSHAGTHVHTQSLVISLLLNIYKLQIIILLYPGGVCVRACLP